MSGLPDPQALLDHYDRHGRTLPWRKESDLYRLWISEIMLQQTGVETVIPYYQRFLARFPTVAELAQAPLSEVLTLWQGLGYYQRARNLHRAAQILSANIPWPETREFWQSLPGVGPSTAAAILAIGRNQPLAILDGNVKRVLARLMALQHPPDKALATLWQMAEQLTPRHRPGDYAQAIMDLGATLCRPKHPRCEECPWQRQCQAHAREETHRFPLPKAKKIRPAKEQTAALILDRQGRLLLLKRPEKGLLGGLWEPPATDGAARDPQEPLREISQQFALTLAPRQALPPVKHAFTHFHLTVHPWLCDHLAGSPRLLHHDACRWALPREWEQLPLSTLHRKIIAAARMTPHS